MPRSQYSLDHHRLNRLTPENALKVLTKDGYWSLSFLQLFLGHIDRLSSDDPPSAHIFGLIAPLLAAKVPIGEERGGYRRAMSRRWWTAYAHAVFANACRATGRTTDAFEQLQRASEMLEKSMPAPAWLPGQILVRKAILLLQQNDSRCPELLLEAEARFAEERDFEKRWRGLSTVATTRGVWKFHAGDQSALGDFLNAMDLVDRTSPEGRKRFDPDAVVDSDTFVNGVDAETGKLLQPDPVGPLESEKLESMEHRRLQHWHENYSIDDPLRRPIHGVDPEDLAQTGWAVIFAGDVDDEVRKALKPLLEHRERQAASLYREIDHDDTDGLRFLESYGVAFGPAVPEKLPYYLLIVGDPARLPYEFQYRLDVQHAVGRLHFDTPEEYARYAQVVLEAERSNDRERGVVIWSTDIAGDSNTHFMNERLARPLFEDLDGWSESLYQVEWAPDGRRSTLLGLLSDAPPALLFTASHGVTFKPERVDRHREIQGSLLCEEWRPGQPVTRGHYLAGQDVSRLDLRGTITFHFACYSVGCSERDAIDLGMLGRGARLAERAFVSRLSQRLLTSGAQATVGHVDRAWKTSFSWQEQNDQPRIFMAMLRMLVEGKRLGHTTDWIHERYAECATVLSEQLQLRLPREGPLAARLTELRKVTLDTRNYLVIGDPAVRLVGAAVRKRSREG